MVYSFRHGVEMRAHEYGTLRDELDQALILLDMFREDANVAKGGHVLTATALDQIEAKVRTMRDALVELNKRLDLLEARA